MSKMCPFFQNLFEKYGVSVGSDQAKKIFDLFESAFFWNLPEHSNFDSIVRESNYGDFHNDFYNIYSFLMWIVQKKGTSKCCFNEFKLCGAKNCLKSVLYRHIRKFFYDEQGAVLHPIIFVGNRQQERMNNTCAVCLTENFPPCLVLVVTHCRHGTCLLCFILWYEERLRSFLRM